MAKKSTPSKKASKHLKKGKALTRTVTLKATRSLLSIDGESTDDKHKG